MTERGVAAAQAAYFVGTGVWPLVSRRSFELVTGPKTDFWLAQTVGVVVTAIGASLGQAAARRRIAPELRTVAVASALGLGLVDVYFVARGRIARTYLIDAVAEAALVAAWLAADGRPNGFQETASGETPVPC